MILKKVWVKPVISLLFCLLLLTSGFLLVKQIKQIFSSPKLSFDKIHQLDFKGTDREAAMVKRVIDGDTIELKDGRRVRYIGINTSEIIDPQKPIMECFGKEAKEKNKELVEGKMVELEKDISEIDKYGRLLRYVYLNDIFINQYLVENGYARIMTIPPDIKFAILFLEKEKLARENN